MRSGFLKNVNNVSALRKQKRVLTPACHMLYCIVHQILNAENSLPEDFMDPFKKIEINFSVICIYIWLKR